MSAQKLTGSRASCVILDDIDEIEEAARQRADTHYNLLKTSGELQAREDHRALMFQLNEGPKP